jgi:hypothetical protein
VIASSIHGVVAIKTKSAPLLGGEVGRWTTDIVATLEDGQTVSFTFFSAAPLSIQGAEFVNYVASGETEAA